MPTRRVEKDSSDMILTVIGQMNIIKSKYLTLARSVSHISPSFNEVKDSSIHPYSIFLVHIILFQHINRATSFFLRDLPSKVESYVANLVVVMYQLNVPFHRGCSIRRVSAQLAKKGYGICT